MKSMPMDYANLKGNKIMKIMKASGNIYYQFPNGIIKTGGAK